MLHVGPAPARSESSRRGPLCTREHFVLVWRVCPFPYALREGNDLLRPSAGLFTHFPLWTRVPSRVLIFCGPSPVVLGLPRPGSQENLRSVYLGSSSHSSL